MRSRGLVMERFSHLLQSAEYLVVCDADLSDVALNLFENCSGKKFHVLDYSYKKLSGRSCQFVTNRDKHYEHLTEDLLAENPIVYMFSTRKNRYVKYSNT